MLFISNSSATTVHKVDANILKLYDKIAPFYKKKSRRAHFGQHMYKDTRTGAAETTATTLQLPIDKRAHAFVCLPFYPYLCKI